MGSEEPPLRAFISLATGPRPSLRQQEFKNPFSQTDLITEHTAGQDWIYNHWLALLSTGAVMQGCSGL
ncbi:hypothetical protein GCM10022406_26630 [Hymenobacter algoricola]|uniref:Uncharacterized protein n=1 Tax=Hymenobacter algoricola TaxID=486267 RepID=A0ABP7NAT6_9BACT